MSETTTVPKQVNSAPTTAEAQRAPQVGSVTSTVKPATTPQPVASPKPSVAQSVNAVMGARTPLPAGLVSKSTDDIVSPWFRCCLYGEIDSWKTVTAAEFGGPEDTRIILTRGEDQLRGLTGKGYKFVECKNVELFKYAMLYPEQVWPEWANRPNRVVVVDDITRGKDLLLEDNETDDQGRERRDMRAIHREAKSDMGDLVGSLFRKPLHVILVSLAQIYTNNITREENVTPDVPPAMSRLLMADASFVFFLDKSKRLMLTSSKRETYKAKNDKGQEETFTRMILARHKVPKDWEGKGIISEYEKIDLKSVWERIRAGKGTTK